MKTAFITGSSRGIGRALAIRLAKDGYKVIVHGASSIKNCKETVRIIKENGGEAEYIIADLCNLDVVVKLAEKIKNIDALVLNASLQYDTYIDDLCPEDMMNHFTCNAISSVMLIKAVLPYMKSQNWGRIVTIGSVNERKPIAKLMAYSASKAAQTNIALSLSMQVAKDGITVNNVAPGVIYTDRNTVALSDPEYAKKVMDSIPVGFYGKPEDCAGTVSLLCSDEGRYITGQSIYVDGGKGI